MVNQNKVVAYVAKLEAKFLQVTDKITSISDEDTGSTSVATVGAIVEYIQGKMAEASTLILGETSTTAYRGDRGKTAYDHSQLTSGNPHHVSKSDVGLGNVSNVEQAPVSHVTDSSAHSGLFAQKADLDDIPGKFSDLTDDSGFDTRITSVESDVEDLEENKADTTYVDSELAKKTINVEKQTTAEAGFLSTYVIKQNGAQVGSKINIPKDYLVKSANMGTCDTKDTPVTGYKVGDKYLDFVINTKDSSGSDEHIYIKVSDLVDTYTVDDTSTIDMTLTDNKISGSVKNGSIGTSQLSSSVNGILNGIPDDTSDLTNGAGFITASGADSEIDAYLDAIVAAL